MQISRRSPPLIRRVTGSSATTDIKLTPIPDLGSDHSPKIAAMWYPDAFDDMSSGLGSDDVPLSIYEDDLWVNGSPPPRIKRRRVIFSLIADVYKLTSIHSGLYPNYHTFHPWCLRPCCQSHPLRVPSRCLWGPSVRIQALSKAHRNQSQFVGSVNATATGSRCKL